MEQKNIIMCVPFGAPGYTPGEGFMLANCDRCHNSMWIGPKQKRKKDEEKIEALCFLCVKGLVESGDSVVNTLKRLDEEGKK